MKLVLALPDGLVARLLGQASLCEMTIEEYIKTTLEADVNDGPEVPLTATRNRMSPEISVPDLIKTALIHAVGQTLTVPKIWERYSEHRWIDISPSDRKRLGRDFRKQAAFHASAAASNDRVLVRVGVTQQNTTLYTSQIKSSITKNESDNE